MIAMWGINQTASEVTLSFTDGTTESLQPVDGTALWAWDADLGLADIVIVGASNQVREQLTRLYGWWLPEVPYHSCAE